MQLRSQGCGILLISEDLEEIFQLADRILVMSRGRIAGEFAANEADVQSVGLLMGGVAKADNEIAA